MNDVQTFDIFKIISYYIQHHTPSFIISKQVCSIGLYYLNLVIVIGTIYP